MGYQIKRHLQAKFVYTYKINTKIFTNKQKGEKIHRGRFAETCKRIKWLKTKVFIIYLSIRLFSNALEHLRTTIHTLLLAHTESCFSQKKSHVLVFWLRNRGQVCTQILPPSIYLSIYLSNPLNKMGILLYSILYNKIKPCYVFTNMTDDSNIFILSCMILYFIQNGK